jgi:hypothetical protein
MGANLTPKGAHSCRCSCGGYCFVVEVMIDTELGVLLVTTGTMGVVVVVVVQILFSNAANIFL